MSRTPKFEAGDFSKTIGRRLRWLRQIQGLNLEEIERRSKLKGKTVQRYECGGISIPLDAVAVLAAALNVSPSRLCGPLNDCLRLNLSLLPSHAEGIGERFGNSAGRFNRRQMKTSRAALDSLNQKLSTENEALSLALSDLCNGAVKWFGNSRTYSIGISRPTGAAGGICIVRQSGMTYAYYFEQYARETLAHISCIITGANTEHNTELARERSAIEAAQSYVSEQLRAA